MTKYAATPAKLLAVHDTQILMMEAYTLIVLCLTYNNMMTIPAMPAIDPPLGQAMDDFKVNSCMNSIQWNPSIIVATINWGTKFCPL